MARHRRCIGCGAIAPKRRLTDHGWTATQCAAKGKGMRWYRQCGCMVPRAYHALVDELFDAGRDYPHRFPAGGRNLPKSGRTRGE